MIDLLIFFGIGIAAIYALYRLTRKEAIEGNCASCPFSDGCINEKKLQCTKNKIPDRKYTKIR